jgi:hypothetical protein
MSNEEFMQAVKRQVVPQFRTYRSEEGHLMVGYKHDLTAVPAMGIESGDRISPYWCDQLLVMDLARLGQKRLAEELGVAL